jgi:hypothetical protein
LRDQAIERILGQSPPRCHARPDPDQHAEGQEGKLSAGVE